MPPDVVELNDWIGADDAVNLVVVRVEVSRPGLWTDELRWIFKKFSVNQVILNSCYCGDPFYSLHKVVNKRSLATDKNIKVTNITFIVIIILTILLFLILCPEVYRPRPMIHQELQD